VATLAELIERRETLASARANGLRAFQYSDNSRAEYKSDAEMASAIAALDREIASASGTPRVSVIRISSSKGL
jgi:hypothetical protein